MRLILRTVDGNRKIAELDSSIDGRWALIQELVAGDFECSVDEIASLERDDGSEVITARGVAAAWIERKSGWDVLGVG